MINAPEKMPAASSPAIARPTMSAVDEGAAPHISEPISKQVIASRKTSLMLKWV